MSKSVVSSNALAAAVLLHTPIPATSIRLTLNADCGIQLTFVSRTDATIEGTPVAAHELLAIKRFLESYFLRQFQPLTDAITPQGTPFQEKVWHRLRQIPVGQTLTYGELARQLGSSPRAIGNACRHNPLPILTPCHRVVGKHSIGGFIGQSQGKNVAIKQWLLQHEQKAAA